MSPGAILLVFLCIATIHSFMPKVALVISELHDEFIRGMVRGVTRFANDHKSWDWEIHLHDGNGGQKFISHQFEGIILALEDLSILRECERAGLVGVQAFRTSHPFSVNHDEEQIGEMAAEHLAKTGRRLSTLGIPGEKTPTWLGERVTGFCRWAQAHGEPVETLFLGGIPPGPSIHFGKWAPSPRIVQWVSSLPKPIGIFCADIHLAREVLAVCRFLELSVPAEVSVIGVDNDELLCLMERPTLSVVITQPEKVGFHAAEILDRRLRNTVQTEEERLLIPPAGVAERGSTRADFGGDIALSNALAFIRNNLSQPLNIDDLARKVGVSRRALYLRSAKHLGISPLQEILRQRIEKSKSLLVGTTLPLAKIAELSGFGDPYNFSRTFRRETGCSPREHRLQSAARLHT
jgi:LacI family transcriptional regulator